MRYKFVSLLIIFCFSLFGISNEEVVVSFEKNWNFSPSIENLSKEEISFINASHIKELFNATSGTWISRGSGQESLISIRSPVLTGSGACGSFLILEDSLPIRPAGFCNVNNFFEVSSNLSSSI